ncbi:SAGA-associated factor 11-like [Pyrus x bretschneideri]|uniref:SAGA-associated factor 11-like n=1 Tax=Pyrus x bretschneideri TaxID=225117 RepID=UPI00202DE09F|nr:SAGA-associated factor 11-like [Pyrus x bretschneideri]
MSLPNEETFISCFGDLLDSIIVDVASECHRIAKCFECMNCGRSIMDGRFAPHLEKCVGKGRKAHLKVTRSTPAAHTHNSWGNPASTYSKYSSSSSISQLSNGASGVAGEEYSNGALEEP